MSPVPFAGRRKVRILPGHSLVQPLTLQLFGLASRSRVISEAL